MHPLSHVSCQLVFFSFETNHHHYYNHQSGFSFFISISFQTVHIRRWHKKTHRTWTFFSLFVFSWFCYITTIIIQCVCVCVCLCFNEWFVRFFIDFRNWLIHFLNFSLISVKCSWFDSSFSVVWNLIWFFLHTNWKHKLNFSYSSLFFNRFFPYPNIKIVCLFI